MDLSRVYEINILFDPALSESDCVQKVNSIIGKLAKYGPASILEKRLNYELAYPVKKRKVAHWFSIIFVTLMGSAIEELKKQLLLDETVLRFLIVKLNKSEEAKLQAVTQASRSGGAGKSEALSLESMKSQAVEIYRSQHQ